MVEMYLDGGFEPDSNARDPDPDSLGIGLVDGGACVLISGEPLGSR